MPCLKNAVPLPSKHLEHRWNACGTSGFPFHLCSRSVPPKRIHVERRNPLPHLKNQSLFHLFHQKTTYPGICTREPCCRPVCAFHRRGGNVPGLRKGRGCGGALRDFPETGTEGFRARFLLWHIAQKGAFDLGTLRVDKKAGESGGVTAPSAAHIVRQRRSKKARKIGVCWLSPSKCTKEKSGVVNQSTRQNRGHQARKCPFLRVFLGRRNFVHETNGLIQGRKQTANFFSCLPLLGIDFCRQIEYVVCTPGRRIRKESMLSVPLEDESGRRILLWLIRSQYMARQ